MMYQFADHVWETPEEMYNSIVTTDPVYANGAYTCKRCGAVNAIGEICDCI